MENQTKEKVSAALEAIRAVADLVIQSVKDTGRVGMPAGYLYSSLSNFGCTKPQFDQIMSVLVESGRIEKRGQVYFSATLEEDEAKEQSPGKTAAREAGGL